MSWKTNCEIVACSQSVSVTLEVSRGGETRWFATRESGEFPRCGDPEGCGCGVEQGGYAALSGGYAVLKFGLLDKSHQMVPVGEVRIAQLSVGAVGVLLGVEDGVGTLVRTCGQDVSGYAYAICRALCAGRFASGAECGCDVYRRDWYGKCEACRRLQMNGVDARWLARSFYNGSANLGNEFAWFNGVTDAAGMVEGQYGRCAPWLSCRTARWRHVEA
jgi:hypothetical protein